MYVTSTSEKLFGQTEAQLATGGRLFSRQELDIQESDASILGYDPQCDRVSSATIVNEHDNSTMTTFIPLVSDKCNLFVKHVANCGVRTFDYDPCSGGIYTFPQENSTRYFTGV